MFHCLNDALCKVPQGGCFESKFIRELLAVIPQESVFSIAEMEIKYFQLMQNSN